MQIFMPIDPKLWAYIDFLFFMRKGGWFVCLSMCLYNYVPLFYYSFHYIDILCKGEQDGRVVNPPVFGPEVHKIDPRQQPDLQL